MLLSLAFSEETVLCKQPTTTCMEPDLERQCSAVKLLVLSI
jgi:hypothetical protein